MRDYKEHFVAFLDILGFKELITHFNCNEIYQIFTEIHPRIKGKFNYNGFQIQAYEHIQYRILSDSVIVFVDSEIEDSFAALIDICSHLQVSLANRENPIFLRGGITKGLLYYEEDIIYGEGLTKAYLMENNLAKYPRIIFTEETLNEGKDNAKYMFPKLEMFDGCFDVDDDFLNYISYTPYNLGFGIEKTKDYFDRLLLLCKMKLDNETNDSLREKYIWLKQHIKKSISHMSQLEELYKKVDEKNQEERFENFNNRFSIYRK